MSFPDSIGESRKAFLKKLDPPVKPEDDKKEYGINSMFLHVFFKSISHILLKIIGLNMNSYVSHKPVPSLSLNKQGLSSKDNP
jgi:hypothetical protein